MTTDRGHGSGTGEIPQEPNEEAIRASSNIDPGEQAKLFFKTLWGDHDPLLSFWMADRAAVETDAFTQKPTEPQQLYSKTLWLPSSEASNLSFT